MDVVDLTWPLRQGDPRVDFSYMRTIEDGGANVTRLSAAVHAGTHLDAPGHMVPGARTVDATPLSACIGVAEVLDLPRHAEGRLIDAHDLDPFTSRVRAGSRLLLRTGWSERYGWPGHDEGYPALTVDGARWIADHGAALVGIDSVSIAPVYAGMETAVAVHLPLFERDVLILEGLRNLTTLRSPRVYLIALPLPLVGRDGSLVRAVAYDGEELHGQA